MTLREIADLDREYLTPAEVASVLDCDPQYIRDMARTRPEELGFPVIRIGNRTKILRAPFLAFMTGNK